MPVKLLLQGVTPSNKLKKYAIQQSARAYRYKFPNLGSVTVTKPFIDKLSLTVPVPDAELQEAIKSYLMDVGKNDLEDFQPANPSKKLYNVSAHFVDPENGATVLVQVAPKKKKPLPKFLRLEFNPNLLGPEGLERFKAALLDLSLQEISWAKVIECGRLTRTDIAVDIVNCPITELVFNEKGKGKSHLYFGLTDKLETAYFAVPQQGMSKQKVYDKAKQIEDMGLSPLYDGVNCTRVEITRIGGKLKKLGDTKNPFTKISVCHPTEAPLGEDPILWNFYLDSCRFRGVEAATSMLPEAKRESFVGQLDQSISPCWQPEKIWDHWDEMLMRSGLLSASQ